MSEDTKHVWGGGGVVPLHWSSVMGTWGRGREQVRGMVGVPGDPDSSSSSKLSQMPKEVCAK